MPARLHAAWRADPTLPRLLRWLVAGGDGPTSLKARAKKALAGCPKNAGQQVGLLRMLVRDVPGAGALLSEAPGLGWSSPDHPGHMVFPLLAMLLTKGPIADALTKELDATAHDVLQSLRSGDDERTPMLKTPSVATVMAAVCAGMSVAGADADVAIEAMLTAADKRAEGVLNNSRRRHYGHAALLVASCVAYAPKSRHAELTHWAAALRQRYWRRHAFRQELTRAFDALGVREIA